MPQLDHVTFFPQFFWLFIIYLAFYLVILKHFLPPLSRILKFRKKKITFSQQGVSGVNAEKTQISTTLDGLVERSGTGSENLFQTNLQAIHFWLNRIFLESNKTEWKEIHPHYLSYLGEKSLSRNAAIDLALEKTSETRLFPSLIDKLNKLLPL